VNGQKCDVLHRGKNVSLLAVQGINALGSTNASRAKKGADEPIALKIHGLAGKVN